MFEKRLLANQWATLLYRFYLCFYILLDIHFTLTLENSAILLYNVHNSYRSKNMPFNLSKTSLSKIVRSHPVCWWYLYWHLFRELKMLPMATCMDPTYLVNKSWHLLWKVYSKKKCKVNNVGSRSDCFCRRLQDLMSYQYCCHTSTEHKNITILCT